MTEVEALYKNAGVKKYRFLDRNNKIGWKYPSFTAEKQLELIKWSARREPKVEIGYSPVHGYCVENPTDTCYYFGEQFDNALASLINILWEDLTEQEQQQIKEILQCLK